MSTQTDPKTLSDEKLISDLQFEILHWTGMSSPALRAQRQALMSEYLKRKLTDYVIDDFLEFLGMSRLGKKD